MKYAAGYVSLELWEASVKRDCLMIEMKIRIYTYHDNQTVIILDCASCRQAVTNVKG